MKKSSTLLSIFFTAIFVLTSCVSGANTTETKNKMDLAEIVFQARLFQPLTEGEDLYLEMVDEVTGIALNPTRYKMIAIGSAEYSIRLPLSVGSVVRYRYVRNSSQNMIENDAKGKQVLYRLYQVDGPGLVDDLVAGWDGQVYSAETGEVSGYVYDAKTEAPLGEILVSVIGMQSYTSFDGFYKFENVPTGEFPIVALHTDGAYEVFQQKAIVANNSVTPATFGMQRAEVVNITFEVRIPEDTVSGAVVRLLGNIHQLGNSFSEMGDGTSVMANLSPALANSKENIYRISVALPAGLDLRYKYSLGDGFVNAEHSADSSFRVRQLIVPNRDTVIRDNVETWYSGSSAPVQFMVGAPTNTPSGDSLSIQFNPYTWMNPIPMWNSGGNEWTYTLYGPFDYLDQSQYRFCRNEACGIADDEVTRGVNGTGYLLDLTNGTPLSINYQIAQWFGADPLSYSAKSSSASDNLLIKGFELSSSFDRKWITHMGIGLVEAAVNGGNWIFFSPTWTFEADGSSGLDPRYDSLASDIRTMVRLSNDAGLSFAVFPQMNASNGVDTYWSNSDLSYNWWQRWFESYRRFVLNYADFASQNGINTLIVGGESVSPAFPSGKLPNGSFANTPYNFEEKWQEMISELRYKYSGQIGFAMPYSTNMEQIPAFVGGLDFIYLEMDGALAASTNPGVDELRSRFAGILDAEIYKLYATHQKPVILGIEYTSIDGTASDCLNFNNSCHMVLGNSSQETLPVDTNEQADVYYAILQEVSARPWILGVVSRGFNPSVAVQDASSSVHGKPAMQVLSAFFY